MMFSVMKRIFVRIAALLGENENGSLKLYIIENCKRTVVILFIDNELPLALTGNPI